ncbi:MAG TPA: hypothetical protein VN922_01515 [Bacteroidia bacterium]|nr:hypothetical protein [Bacteroidia bacterium]
MKVILNQRKSVLHKVATVLNEVYNRSIYKRMAQDLSVTIKHISDTRKPITAGKKVEVDKNDDLPRMLFI